MQDYQKDFIQLAIDNEVLCFGEFSLKSGRTSPFFFNAGRFSSGAALAALGKSYAAAIMEAGFSYDVLLGPAYKGIPLVASVAVALSEQYQQDVPYCFNRKESKSHGEGGVLVGADISGKKVLIVDDVITAGTAIREVMAFIAEAGAEPAGVLIGLDRQERGQGDISAIQEVEQDYKIAVKSVIKLDHIVEFLEKLPENEQLVSRIGEYRRQYGCQA